MSEMKSEKSIATTSIAKSWLESLLLLPWEVFREILSLALCLTEAESLGSQFEVKHIDLSLKWSALGVLMSLPEVDVIVDFMGSDSCRYARSKLFAELGAYHEEKGAEGKKVYLLAIGGSVEDEQNCFSSYGVPGSRVVLCTWKRLKDIILALYGQMEDESTEARILRKVAVSMAGNGFVVGRAQLI